MGLTCPVFTAIGGPGTIAITITPVSGETVADYVLRVYSNSAGTTQIASDVITGTTKTFTGLSAGTYYVRVTPSNNVNADPTCSLSNGVVVTAAQLATPIISFTNVANNGFRINWTKDAHSTNFSWQVATDAGFSNAVGSGGGTNTGTYLWSGGTTGTLYYVRIIQSDINNVYPDSNQGTGSQTTT